jgi:hypothetical protein
MVLGWKERLRPVATWGQSVVFTETTPPLFSFSSVRSTITFSTFADAIVTVNIP